MLIPLDGAYFCRKCKQFLGFDGLTKRCPQCNTKVNLEHKMKLVDGEWIKVKRDEVQQTIAPVQK